MLFRSKNTPTHILLFAYIYTSNLSVGVFLHVSLVTVHLTKEHQREQILPNLVRTNDFFFLLLFSMNSSRGGGRKI